MAGTEFDKIQQLVLLKLNGLDPYMLYHCKAHTVDVLHQSERIARAEGVTDKHAMFLLKVAALYHDTGFLETYNEHEKKGCDIFLKDALQFHFSPKDKQQVVDLIMATKIPQQPVGLLQEIICDADLDYLGRNDFKEIASHLKEEFFHYGVITDEEDWKKLQILFLENHQYHTRSSRELRDPVKKTNLAGLLR
ncbi:MAG TPA: HD domain-containing protein [Ferruginibacter sp.]|nr:HD domain-containing protein [Ferruginibacter sp.]